MTRPIPFIDATASRAFPAGIPWVHDDHRDAFSLGFVFDKSTELMKRPGVVQVSLRLSKPYPIAYPIEVFEDYHRLGAFSFSDYLFADPVVFVFGKTGFLAPALLEQTFSGWSPFFLELLSELHIAATLPFELVSGEGLSGTREGNLNDSEVNTEEVLGVELRGLRDIANLVDVKGTFAKDKIGLTSSMLEQFKLSRTADKRYLEPSCYRPDRNDALVYSPRKDARIVGNAASLAKFALHLLVGFVGVGNLGEDTHRNLGGKAKIFSYQLVERLVQVVVSESLMIPSKIRDGIRCAIGCYERALERLKLLFRRFQFYLGYQFHIISYRILRGFYQTFEESQTFFWAKAAKARSFPPGAEAPGFPALKVNVK